VDLSVGFKLYWTLEKTEIRYGVERATPTNDAAYIGLGFGSRMIGSPAIVSWINGSDVGQVTEYFLESPAKVLPASNLGLKHGAAGFQDSTDGQFRQTMVFTLARGEELPPSLIYATGKAPVGSSKALNYHFNNKGVKAIDLSTGEVSDIKDNKRTAHGVLMTLAWAFFLPLGMYIPRFFKEHDPLWFYAHIACQVVGITLSIAGFILTATNDFIVENADHDLPNSHRIVGLTVFVLGLVQFCIGVVRPGKESSVRVYWSMVHHWLGRVAVALAIVAISLALVITEADIGYIIAFAMVTGLIHVMAAALEIRRLMTSGTKAYQRVKEEEGSSYGATQ